MIRRTRRVAALSGAAALGVAGAVVLVLGLTSGKVPERAPTAVEGSATASQATPAAASTSVPAGSSPVATPSPSAMRTPSSSVHLLVPSAGMDVPVLPLTARRGVIDPPTMTAGYWVQPYGRPGPNPDNTVYIAGHSWTRGSAAFDPLMGVGGSHVIRAGDAVQVRTPAGTVTYKVIRTARYAKNRLADTTDVWEAVPGRLVLLTCFVDSRGHATNDNFVVFAARV